MKFRFTSFYFGFVVLQNRRVGGDPPYTYETCTYKTSLAFAPAACVGVPVCCCTHHLRLAEQHKAPFPSGIESKCLVVGLVSKVREAKTRAGFLEF